MRSRFCFILAVAAVGGAARGDEVVLKNGDTISGTITRVTAQVVDVTTEAAGVIHLKRELVKAMLSGGAVPVAGADGKEHAVFLVAAEDWGGWHEGAEAAVVAGGPGGAAQVAQARRPLTAAMALPRQGGQVVLGYLGSSTWALNQGSGQVPAIIDGMLKAQYPGVALVTVNGSISGARVGTYKPGDAALNKLKAEMQAAKGFKVLRVMIGSNDAAAGMATAEWKGAMKGIIEDALAWPVDLIVLEEIGARTDKEGANGLIKEYNAARVGLAGGAGEKVMVGTAHTLQNQSDHLETLLGDHIHQQDVGQNMLAGTQAAEVGGMFARAGAATRGEEHRKRVLSASHY